MSDYVPMRFPEIKPTFRASCTDVARMSTDVEMSNHVASRHACRMRSGWQVEICKMFASVVALPNGSHWVVSLWAVGEDTAWILDPYETSNSRKKISNMFGGTRGYALGWQHQIDGIEDHTPSQTNLSKSVGCIMPTVEGLFSSTDKASIHIYLIIM